MVVVVVVVVVVLVVILIEGWYKKVEARESIHLFDSTSFLIFKVVRQFLLVT